MEKTNFENLEIYKLAEELADHVWEIVVKWRPLAQDTVGKQLIRSADSIGANIAEGSGRGSEQDYRRFIRIARGSLNETRHWLRRAFKRQLLTESEISSLTPIIEKLTPKLNAYLKAIGTFKRKSGGN
jgi:four helix bundle protein